MAARPPQITTSPTPEFAEQWEKFRKGNDVTVREAVCAGLLAIMRLPAAQRDYWLKVFRMAEATGFETMPEITAFDCEFDPSIQKPGRKLRG